MTHSWRTFSYNMWKSLRVSPCNNILEGSIVWMVCSSSQHCRILELSRFCNPYSKKSYLEAFDKGPSNSKRVKWCKMLSALNSHWSWWVLRNATLSRGLSAISESVSEYLEQSPVWISPVGLGMFLGAVMKWTKDISKPTISFWYSLLHYMQCLVRMGNTVLLHLSFGEGCYSQAWEGV